ncbi:MAG: hypothetical protein NXI31_13500 [bacterium]|nr:hypothetical protein [bacterium]
MIQPVPQPAVPPAKPGPSNPWYTSEPSIRIGLVLLSVTITSTITGVAQIGWAMATVVGLCTVTSIFTLCVAVRLFQKSRRGDPENRAQAIYEQVQKLVSGSGVHVEYVEEDESNYKGRIYRRLTEVVEQATESIEIMDLPSRGTKITPAAAHPERLRYLQALTHSVERAGPGFRFRRVEQIAHTPGCASPEAAAPMRDLLPPAKFDHTRAVLRLRDERKTEAQVRVMCAWARRSVSFLVIDRRTLVLQALGRDAAGHEYMCGTFFITDNTGNVVRPFLELFDSVANASVNLQLHHFDQDPPNADPDPGRDAA